MTLTAFNTLTHTEASAAVRAVTDRNSYRWILGSAMLLINTDVILRSGQNGPTIYFAEVTIWIVALSIFFSEYVVFRRDVLASAVRRTPIEFSYLAWCSLVALLAVAYSGSGDLVGKVKNLLPGFLLGVLIVHTVRTERSFNSIVACLLIGLVVNAALGALQFFDAAPYLVTPLANNVWKTDIFGQLLSRTANGLFSAPNNLGVALMPGVLISFAYFLQSLRVQKWLLAIGLTILLGVLVAGLYATQNKGCFVWTAIGVPFCLTRMRFRLLFAVSSVILVIVFLARYGGSQISGPDTLAIRVQLWLAAERAISEHPAILLTGDGLQYMPYWGATLARWALKTSHNTWLDQVLMYGGAGLFLYAAIWVKSIVLAARAEESTSFWIRTASAGVFASLVALAGELFFEPRADGLYQLAQIFVLFALARCLWRASQSVELRLDPKIAFLPHLREAAQTRKLIQKM